MTEDLFNSNPENPNNPGVNDIPPSSPDTSLADLLASITNPEGKPKYDSVDKALKALKDSQEYIARLEVEKKTEREELERLRALEDQRENVEDIVNRLLTANKNNPEPAPQATPQDNGGVDANAVQRIVQEAMQAQRQSDLAEQNAKLVTTTLINKFGDKAGEVIAAKAAELGMTPQELGELAKKNPNLVLPHFNVTVAPKATPTTTSVNLPPTGNKELERPKLEKTILQGATMRDQMEAFRKAREYTNARLGVTGN